jgi:hypothetical protein
MWRPFDRSLADLDTRDLERLRDERIEEQLYLEYKSEWSARQIAKSIAAFANTEGGTLVVGMTTEGREPVELVGVEHEGDLAESLDRLVRDSIAPRPDYRAKVVPNADGRNCLLVEVPRGEARPYLVTRTGQVVRRTQTGTEPASRDYLDRLFLEGRAGVTWARSIGSSELEGGNTWGDVASIWTIPTVEEGLALGSRLFTQEMWETLLHLLERFPEVRRAVQTKGQQTVNESLLGAFVPEPFGGEPHGLHLEADTRGVVRSAWATDQVGSGDHVLGRLTEWGLPCHKSLYVDSFGYSGKVVVALRNSWPTGSGRMRHVAIMHPEVVLADELDDRELWESLQRQVTRGLGYWRPEPEADT